MLCYYSVRLTGTGEGDVGRDRAHAALIGAQLLQGDVREGEEA